MKKLFLFFSVIMFCSILYAQVAPDDTVAIKYINTTQQIIDAIHAIDPSFVVPKHATPGQLLNYLVLLKSAPGKGASFDQWHNYIILLLIGLASLLMIVLNFWKTHFNFKKLLNNAGVILLLIGLTCCASSCNKNFIQTTASYIEKHCQKTVNTDLGTGEISVHYECASLWKSDNIKNKCENLSICIDGANGMIYGDISCNDTSLVNGVKGLIPK